MRSRRFWLAVFCGHFVVIAAISCSDLIALISGGHTMSPQVVVGAAGKLADGFRKVSPRGLDRGNPARQIIVAYSHIAGIDAPYTFFAPNVPDSLRVVFQLTGPSDGIRQELPLVGSDSEGLRLLALTDSALGTPGLWRDIVLKM